MLLLYALQVTKWQRSLHNKVMSILVNYTYHIHFTPILSKSLVYRNHIFSKFYQTVKCDLITSVFKKYVLKTLFLKNTIFKIVYPNRLFIHFCNGFNFFFLFLILIFYFRIRFQLSSNNIYSTFLLKKEKAYIVHSCPLPNVYKLARFNLL